MKDVIIAVFQTWDTDGKSGLYKASTDGQEAVNNFIRDHHESGTYATLHTFTNEDKALESYNKA